MKIEPKEQAASLSRECEEQLMKRDMYSEPCTHGTVTVRDSEGEWLFDVSADVSAQTLANILNFGQRQFKRGQKCGYGELQRQLRALLDVPANPSDDNA